MRLISMLVPLLASIPAIQAMPLNNNKDAAPLPKPTLLYRDIPATATTTIPLPTLSPELAARDDSSSPTTTAPSSQTTANLLLKRTTSACHPSITPDKNGYVPPWECDAMYDYYPSFKTAVAFTVLFGILLVAHLVEAVTYKITFVWVVIMGVAWEFGGYLARAFSTKNQQSTGIATVTQLLVLLAPLWVNAFDYMVLARMMWFFLPEKRIWMFKPSLLAIIFVCLDFGSFVVQATGGMMASPGNGASTTQLGLHIYMGGIGIQQFFICCFLVLAIQFHRQMLALERKGMLMGDKTRWKGLLYALYFSLVAITVRIIYRLVEYTSGMGLNNPVTTHEWFMYVFDAVPMLFATAVWAVVHPGKILRGPDAVLPKSGLGYWFSCAHCCHGCACCCCCGGRRKTRKSRKSKKGMEPLPSHSRDGSQDMLGLTSVEGRNNMTYSAPTPMSADWRSRAQRTDIAYEPYRSQGA